MHANLKTPAATQQDPDNLRLLRGIGAGDADSLRAFFLRWHDPFFRMALGILRDEDDAEDAASNAILRVNQLATAGNFPPHADDATRWILRVGRNCAFRQRAERPTVRGEWIERLPASNPTAEDDLEEDGVRQTAIARALRHLPEKTRSAVLMYFVQGLSCAEIAVRQGGKPAGAYSRVERGTLQLVAITHSRRGGSEKAEHANNLSPQERAQIRNTAAIVRSHAPHLGARAVAAEVCRRTGIFIQPESSSASLLMDLHQRRIG